MERKLVRPKEIEDKIKTLRRQQLIDDAISRYGKVIPLPVKKWRPGNKKNKLKIKPKQQLPKKKTYKIYPDFYESRAWRELRYKVLKKYERACMVCYRTKIEIHVDHIKPISKHPELALDINNLQVLCLDCNKGKSNYDSIDWRP